MADGLFSERELRALKPRGTEYKLIERAPRGEGRLILKVRPSGLKEFYYRTRAGDDDRLIRIGRFEQTPGSGGMTLAQARKDLQKLVGLQRTTGNAKRELRRQKDAEAHARVMQERAARTGTFEHMMDAYVSDLRARGRVSAKAVENTFLRDVKGPFPDLCAGLAKAVTAGDVQAILARLVRKGIRRGVNLLRSHLNAAFQYAAKADNDPTRLANDGAIFEILANPVALIPRKPEFEGVGERNLSALELGRFWHGLAKVDLPVARGFLRLDISLGGQRGIQLLRTMWPDYDFEAKTVLLRERKGRGGVVRDHLLPLTDLALEALEPLRELNWKEAGPFVTRAGKSLHPSSLSKVVCEVWEVLAKRDTEAGKEKVILKFTFADIRRTLETLLASIGVTAALRSYVLSHGRSGVQSKHYDRWEYLTEKRRVLQKWAKHFRKVIAETATVEQKTGAVETQTTECRLSG